MENSLKQNEYIVNKVTGDYKRVCFTLDLKDNPELIEKYKWYHKAENNWPEINKGIKDSGIEVMDIYLVDNRMFMICEMTIETDLETAWTKMGTYPKQDEWAELMATFQQAIPGHKLEWVQMERVFQL